MDWDYDPLTNTYVCGTPTDGCGVYEEDGRWYANVITAFGGELLPAETTRDAAMAAAEQRLVAIRAEM